MQGTSRAYAINPDIQILRGVSILLVLLYHLNVPFLKSGYLGVDIFFVISGFLMGKLYSDIGSWKDTVTFYKKRLNRILPAYFVTLIITLIISALIALPHEFKDISRHGIWSFILMPNIGFWTDASYFESRYFKPFLNFWSLGVEIHFYLIFPIVAFLFRRAVWLVALSAVGSFALCFLMADISAKTSFFMMPLRFWEFMAGLLVAKMISPNIKVLKDTASPIAFIGIVVLTVLGFSQTEHLKYAAPLITIFSLGILLFEFPNVIRNSLLSKVMQVLGKYSYSIYLVHFPIITLVLYEPYTGINLKPETWTETLSILSLTLVSSVLLYHLVEMPFRKNLMAQYWLPVYGTIIFLGIFLTPVLVAQSREPYSEQELKIFDAWQDRTEYRCGKVRRILQWEHKSCLLNNAEGKVQKSYLLVGNSHADSIKEVLVQLADENKADLRMMKSDCSLGKGACRPSQVINEMIATNSDTVIIHSSEGQVSATAIKELLQEINEDSELSSKFEIVYILPVPRQGFHVPQTLYELSADKIWNHKKQGNITLYNKRMAELNGEIMNIQHDNFKMISVGKSLCNPECQVLSEEGDPLYYDAHHLTLTGASLIKPELKTIFDD